MALVVGGVVARVHGLGGETKEVGDLLHQQVTDQSAQPLVAGAAGLDGAAEPDDADGAPVLAGDGPAERDRTVEPGFDLRDLLDRELHVGELPAPTLA